MFAVQLSVEAVLPLTFPAQVDTERRTALLEPRGVVQLASNSFSGVENNGSVSVFQQCNLSCNDEPL